jgi:hypothetical protein
MTDNLGDDGNRNISPPEQEKRRRLISQRKEGGDGKDMCVSRVILDNDGMAGATVFKGRTKKLKICEEQDNREQDDPESVEVSSTRVTAQ